MSGSSGTGVDQQIAASKSTQTFLTALITNAVVAAVEILVFLIIRSKFHQIYQPRNTLARPGFRSQKISNGISAFFKAVLRTPASQIIDNNGLDAYMFVRFLLMMTKVFAVFMALTWPILFCVDFVKSGGTQKGVNIFTFGNIGATKDKQTRYAAHCVLVWVLSLFVIYLINSEMTNYVSLRHAFLTSANHIRLPQSRTVLITGVPKDYLTAQKIKDLTASLPGGIKRFWFVRDLDKSGMSDLYDRRNKAVKGLEGAETKLIKQANKLERNRLKKGQASILDVEEKESQLGLDRRLLPAKKRPKKSLFPVPVLSMCMGKKVDAIEWGREEVSTCNKELEILRDEMRKEDETGELGEGNKFPRLSGVFIQFRQQMAAYMFAQSVLHPQPLRMVGRYTEVSPPNVIWSSLSINPYQAKVRKAISWTLTIALIVFWAIPVAFVGLISNVNALCVKAPWLAWLCKLPVPVNGIIQGILPPVFLAVLFMLLPIVLRLFAVFEGVPLHSLVELSLMKRYFAFLVIHGFLVVTISSSLVSTLPQIIGQPTSVASTLSQNLPQANVFFLTYFVTTGLSGGAGAILQISTLVVYYVMIIIFGGAPRSIYNLRFKMGSVAWGTIFPNMTLLAVIGFAYSIIAPIMNGLAVLAFGLFWFVYKYLFLFVFDQPKFGETGGLFFPIAMQHVFTGLYIGQICLAGLFFLTADDKGKHNAIGEGIATILLVLLTIGFHLSINSAFAPLEQNLPLALYNQSLEHHELDEEEVDTSGQGHGGFSGSKTTATYSPSVANSRLRGASVEKERLTENTEKHFISPRSIALNLRDPFAAFETDHAQAFDNPAAWAPQEIIWLPKDPLGLAEYEVEACQTEGVDASVDGATLDDKGKVDITKRPPGWNQEEEDNHDVVG